MAYLSCMLLALYAVSGVRAAPSTVRLIERFERDSYTPPSISPEHINDTFTPFKAIFDLESGPGSHRTSLGNLFSVILAFTMCNQSWIEDWMLAKQADWTGQVPSDVIPVVHYGVNPQDNEIKGHAAVKSDLKELKRLFELDGGKSIDLGENWWPWALAEGVAASGWSPDEDDSNMPGAVHALSGFEAEVVTDKDEDEYWDEYLVHAHETPTWIRMDLFNWIWVPVLSTEGYGPDRKIFLSPGWNSEYEDYKERGIRYWSISITHVMRLKPIEGNNPVTYTGGERPGGAVKQPIAF